MNEFSMVSADELNRIEGGGFWSGLENAAKDVGKALEAVGKGFENNANTIGAAGGVVGGIAGLLALC
jgi:hypothetical protein